MQNKWFTTWRGQDDSDWSDNGTPASIGCLSRKFTGPPASRARAWATPVGKVIEMLHSEHIKSLPAEDEAFLLADGA